MSRRERLTLVATILASTVVFLDATVVNVALPAVERDLGMGLAGQQWVVEAYLLALVSLLLVGGSLVTTSGGAGSSRSASPASAAHRFCALWRPAPGS